MLTFCLQSIINILIDGVKYSTETATNNKFRIFLKVIIFFRQQTLSVIETIRPYYKNWLTFNYFNPKIYKLLCLMIIYHKQELTQYIVISNYIIIYNFISFYYNVYYTHTKV